MTDRNIRYEPQEGGLLLAVIDMQGRSMNVFSAELMDSLERLLDHVDKSPEVNGVVVTSGKSAFLAGADLEMVNGFTAVLSQGDEAAIAHCSRLSRLYRRLEKSAKPYVCALNGLALGGGLELAMACHERVVGDDARIQLGLPEIKLSLLPGAGGTQRLPRLIGLDAAMPMLLRGQPVPPATALKLGLVDEVVPADRLLAAAYQRVAALSAPKQPWDRTGFTLKPSALDPQSPDFETKVAAAVGIADEELRDYPAYRAIIRCVGGGARRPMDEAVLWEATVFVDLIKSPVVSNMIESLFLNKRKADGLFKPLGALSLRHVALEGGAEALSEELKRAKLEIADLSHADIVLRGGGAARAPSAKAVALLTGPGDRPSDLGCAVGIYLTPATGHGRAIEIVVESPAPEAETRALALARQLRGTPIVTRGASSFLARLAAAKGGDAACLAGIATEAAREGLVQDQALADTAAVIAGLFPAFTGGPFRWLRAKAA